MSEEGFIKYQCEWVRAEPESFAGFAELNQIRDRLHALGFIGVYPNGVGYGNISLRCADCAEFYISGAATGHLAKLGPEHYSKVTAYNFTENRVRCVGPLRASSESMTHAAIYEADATVRAVLHVHDAVLWKALLHRVPTTDVSVEYGTPEMAGEIGRLFRETDVRERRILAMAGHEDGLVTFGANLEDALHVLLETQIRF